LKSRDRGIFDELHSAVSVKSLTPVTDWVKYKIGEVSGARPTFWVTIQPIAYINLKQGPNEWQ